MDVRGTKGSRQNGGVGWNCIGVAFSASVMLFWGGEGRRNISE